MTHNPLWLPGSRSGSRCICRTLFTFLFTHRFTHPGLTFYERVRAVQTDQCPCLYLLTGVKSTSTSHIRSQNLPSALVRLHSDPLTFPNLCLNCRTSLCTSKRSSSVFKVRHSNVYPLRLPFFCAPPSHQSPA